MPRQLRNKGGIMTIGGGGYTGIPMGTRTGFGLISKVKDRIRKLIPNEIASVASKAAPFVAPFNPAIAGLMRGIGRFDQRGSLSDAFKQGLATTAFGAGARALGGATDIMGGGIRGGFTSPLSPDRTTAVKDFFTPGKEKDTDFIKKVTGDTKKDVGLKSVKDATGLFKDVPILKDLPSIVQQQILVGGVSGAATYIYQAFLAEEPPQEEGETYDQYRERRRENVGRKMLAYFDNYFKFDKEYSSMTPEQKKAFVDRLNVRDGGRVSYQTGGITMANTLAENIRRNLANQAAINKVLQAAASKAFPEGNFQKIRASSPTQKDYNIKATKDLVENLPGGIVRDVLAPAAAGVLSLPYDAIQGVTRIKESDMDRAMQTATMSGPKDIIAEAEGLAYARENPLSSAMERTIGAAGPLAERISGETLIPGFTKVEGGYQGPDGQIYGPETYASIAAGMYPNIYNPNKKVDSVKPTLPVEPRTDQDLIEGFKKFKQQNPNLLSGIGIAALIEGTLPDGTPITFSGGAESSAFNKYLESLGLSRANIFTPRADIESKLAKGGMPVGIMRTNKAGVMERDYRDKGGFVPVGIKEKADDVPAMLSKNEFVFTADAVRGAGNGSIEKGAQRMYDTMKKLEKRVV